MNKNDAPRDEVPTVDDICLWLGEAQLNFKMTLKKNKKLREENEALRKLIKEEKEK